MATYYSTQGINGQLNVATNVFTQIAQEKVNELANGALKNSILLKKDKKVCKVTTTCDKNKPIVTVEIFAYTDSNTPDAVASLQKNVYDALYEATEISSLKVVVSVLGFIVR